MRVETDEKRTDGQLVLTLAITPGPVYTLRQIVFQGNAEVPDATLRPILKTSEPALLRRGSGRLVQSDLDADLENLRRYYALAGYTQARSAPPQVERTGEDLRLVIPIQEGPRERVVKMDFQGITSLDLERAAQDPAAPGGGGFHPVLLDGTLDALRAAYAAKGYTRAQLSARQDWNPDHTLVDLTIEVLEGPRQVVDRILVRGNQRTQGDVIQPHDRPRPRRAGQPGHALRDRAQPLPARHLLPRRRGVRPLRPRRDRARRADPGRGGEAAQRPLRHRLGFRGRRPRLARRSPTTTSGGRPTACGPTCAGASATSAFTSCSTSPTWASIRSRSPRPSSTSRRRRATAPTR